MVFDVEKASSQPGADVILFKDNGNMADNQLWYEDANGIICSKLTGFALDASGKYILYNMMCCKMFLCHEVSSKLCDVH